MRYDEHLGMGELTPTPHDWTGEAQPEVCELCGKEVGAHHLQVSMARGLEGRRICDLDECATLRAGLPRQAETYVPTETIGPGGRPLLIGGAHWRDIP